MRQDTRVELRVPSALHREFKDVAGSQNTTVSDLLRKYMETEIQLSKTPAPQN